MTREELWEEFENQLIRETRTSITMNFDTAERMTKLGIKETVAKWKDRLEQEPETAHWIKVPDEETFFCSKCNARLYDEQIYLPFNYCPNCGAKMIEQQGSEDKE